MDYSKQVGQLRATFETGRTLSIDFRLKQLRGLLRLYEENIDKILEALKLDMRKSELEGYFYEVDLMKNDCRAAIRSLRKWAKPKPLRKNWLFLTDSGQIERIPYGVVLVMGSWNYPFQLTLVPVCGAIAGGNCVLIKPSEISSHSAAVMAELIPKYLDSECYQVVIAGPKDGESLLKEKFDYIFFTGSTRVGRKIHAAANKYLTPVTLELGGKSPVYVDDSANYAIAAKRIMWGKCMNMGQTCIAPDYILCSKKVEGKLIQEIERAMSKWYGEDWKKASDLSRIGSREHYDRLAEFLTNSGKVALGGRTDVSELWIEPTILVDVKPTDPIMSDEIFGPILPFITVNSPEEAIQFVNARPVPLCIYIFSKDGALQKRLLESIPSGSAAVNDTIIQFGMDDDLPFGGIGESGMGNYHGKFSYDTFTHQKSVIYRGYDFWGETLGSFRYPPYSKFNMNVLTFLLKHYDTFRITFMDYFPHFIWFLLGIGFAFLIQNFGQIKNAFK